MFQKNANDVLRFVIFMLQKMLFTKCNYEIYDKNFLIIIRTFEKWRFECSNTSLNNSIKMFFDHKNFETFMSIKQLNRRQIKWTKFFFEFNFQIIYRFETKKIKFDNFTRRSQNLFANDFDERRQFNNQIIFKFKNLNLEIRNAIKLNEKIHQLEIETIKLAMIAYLELIKLIITETSRANFDDENFDSNDDLTKKTISIENRHSFTNAASFAFAQFQQTFVVNSFAKIVNDNDNDELDYHDFLSRIKKVYKKNKNLQTIMKTKIDDDRKISIKLIKKTCVWNSTIAKSNSIFYELKNVFICLKNFFYKLTSLNTFMNRFKKNMSIATSFTKNLTFIIIDQTWSHSSLNTLKFVFIVEKSKRIKKRNKICLNHCLFRIVISKKSRWISLIFYSHASATTKHTNMSWS